MVGCVHHLNYHLKLRTITANAVHLLHTQTKKESVGHHGDSEGVGGDGDGVGAEVCDGDGVGGEGYAGNEACEGYVGDEGDDMVHTCGSAEDVQDEGGDEVALWDVGTG